MTSLQYNQDLARRLAAGADALDRALAASYGPRGRNILFEQTYDLPLVMKRGSVALKEMTLPDRAENFAVVALRDAAEQVVQRTGGGSLTTVLLACAMLRAGFKQIAAGADPLQLREGIRQAAQDARQAIAGAAVPVADTAALRQVIETAAQDDEVTRVLGDAFDRLGLHGVVTVEDSQLVRTEVNGGGIRYEYGLQSIHFANDSAGKKALLDRPHILLVNDKLTGLRQLQTLLEQLIDADEELLLIAEDYSPELVQGLLTNVKNGVFRLVAAKAPGHGDTRRRHMAALAARTGGMLLDKETGLRLEDCGLEICGRAQSALIDKDFTSIQPYPMQETPQLRSLRRQTEAAMAAQTDPYEIEKYQLTLSILSGSVLNILVGGTTEYEMFEKKHRYEAALGAAGAAVRGGVVPGGGAGFLLGYGAVRQQCASFAGDRGAGARCVLEALRAPVARLAERCGADGAAAAARATAAPCVGAGLNIVSGRWEDLARAGVLDPAETLCAALEAAASAASTLLTLQAAVLPQ